MFLLKKFLSALFVPPGLFVVLLLLAAFFSRRRKAHMTLFLLLATCLYLASISPVANLVLAPLENEYSIPDTVDLRTAEAYVVLGGGANNKGVDIFGQGTLSGDSAARLVTAYRLYRMVRKPIIISGGAVYAGEAPESEIGKRFLAKLGVRSDHIMTETRSRDTYENAFYTKELCSSKGIRKIVLVTSAYHLRRAMLLFSRFFSDITPCPADFRTSADVVRLRNFFPNAPSFYATSLALHERLGLLFYKIKLRKEGGARIQALRS